MKKKELKPVTLRELVIEYKHLFRDFKEELNENTEWNEGQSGSWTERMRKGKNILYRLENATPLKENEIKEARATLLKAGFFSGNLWHLDVSGS